MKVLRTCFYGFCGLALLVFCLMLGHLHADSPALIISEVKVKNDPAGLDEYIELYNPGQEAVSLNEYSIAYANTAKPTASQSFTKMVIAQGMLGAHQSLLLAKNETDARLPLAQKSPFSSLSDAAGTLQIIDQSDAVVDQLQWTSSTKDAVGGVILLATSTANRSQSITRQKTTQGEYVITPASWTLIAASPESSVLQALVPNVEDADQADADPTPGTDAALLTITELLPNPAAPASDDTDEYIELHNASDAAINLKDYKLQAGTNFAYTYTFDNHVIDGDTYEVFKVSDTHLLLSNSGGRSRLLGPTGVVIAQTEPYDTAVAGKAWALVDGYWQWTDTPTPGAANVVSATSAIAAAAKASSVKTVKSATSTAKPATSTAKPSTASKTTKTAAKPKTTTAAKKTADSSKKTTTNKASGSGGAASSPLLHPLVLAGVVGGAVLYGLYEYRTDIIARLRQFRRNRSFRLPIGSAVEGSGGD